MSDTDTETDWETCSDCGADVRWSVDHIAYVDRKGNAGCDNGKSHFVYES